MQIVMFFKNTNNKRDALKFLHLLIVGGISIVVAITGLALVIHTVTGLVEVRVEIVKPWHLSVCQETSKSTTGN